VRKLVLLAAFAAGLALALHFSKRPKGEGDLYAKSVLGKKGPKLVVEKWIHGPPPTEGKFVLVDFWAAWCPPCRQTIPELNRIAKKFADRLVVIGISGESESAVKNFRNPRIEYYVGIDPQERMARELEVRAIPYVILMDPQGIVRWEGNPLVPSCRLSEAVIEQILRGERGDGSAPGEG